MTRRQPSPAVAAEPGGIGTSGARDPLAVEVRLLGALLGQVIGEQAGPELFDLVERIRRLTIALRRDDDPLDRARLDDDLRDLDLESAEAVIRAFGLYFALVNLAEAHGRVRALRRRERAAHDGVLDDSVADAIRHLRRLHRTQAEIEAAAAGLEISPVLTAHPTEARRRTVLIALGRCASLLARLDDPRLTPSQDRDVRRRLREEITVLWRTSDLRLVHPAPLDEVRTAMAFFDATLFTVVPRLYRALDEALDPIGGRGLAAASDSGRSGTRPPLVGAFLQWGSWIGGDRDGHPGVTAEITEKTLRIQADHVLRGYEAVATRLMQTIAAATPADRVARPLASRLARDAEDLPETDRQLRRRFPDEPYRQRLGFIAERLRRTRAALTGEPAALTARYGGPADLDAELVEIQEALVADGLGRAAWGEVAEFRWQLGTFGFHLASLEIRQHSAVHAAAIEAVQAGQPPSTEVAPGVGLGEVLGTFRAIAAAQARHGVYACRRYVVSFTASAGHVADVLELARLATADEGAGQAPVLDIVPLLESGAALEGAGEILAALLDDPVYRERIRSRGDRQEVMLGYSDSNKELGFLAGAWMLQRAQAALVEAARVHGVKLTIFHGRGGAIGRGGGPANRAILGLAPGSVDGRLKLTEQGEVIAANYSNPEIARRHLEQVVGAVLLASTPEHETRLRRAYEAGEPILAELAATSRAVYRRLVHDDPGFASFFHEVTPIREISDLRLGSRPAARGRRGAAPTIDSLRAIPWTFAWAQARINLPGWYGLGSALGAYQAAHGDAGLDAIARLARDWPFLSSVIDNAEMSLAKADMGVARLYAALATGPGDDRRWGAIESEYRRTVSLLGRLTGHDRLLDGSPVLQRSVALRNPYVDSLSELQVRLLARLRTLAPDDPERDRVLRLVQLTVNGVAAGLQNTG